MPLADFHRTTIWAGVVALAAGLLGACASGSPVIGTLSAADRARMALSTQHALERNRIGWPTRWEGSDGRVFGTVTPTRTYESSDGRLCREFQQTVTAGGETEFVYGVACRRDDGTWDVLERSAPVGPSTYRSR